LWNNDRHLSFRYGECRHLSQLQTKYLSENPVSVYLETVSFSRFCARWEHKVSSLNGLWSLNPDSLPFNQGVVDPTPTPLTFISRRGC